MERILVARATDGKAFMRVHVDGLFRKTYKFFVIAPWLVAGVSDLAHPACHSLQEAKAHLAKVRGCPLSEISLARWRQD
jgi:hypothetical protein